MLTGDILRLSVERHPCRTALICGDTSLSYRDLGTAANRFANALLNLEISKNINWAIMSRNLPEYVIAHFGGAQTGAQIVNLQPSYSSDELATILNLTKAKLIVVEEPFQQKIIEIQDFLSDLQIVVIIGNPSREEWISFDQFIEDQPSHYCNLNLSETDIFAMTFTGGTTGIPKGTLVNHQARFISCYTTAIEHQVTEADIIGLVTPFYHTMGSLVWLPTAIFLGATTVIMTEWDPAAFVDQVKKNGITCTFMVPIQLRQILSNNHFDMDKLRSLTNIACGGAPSSSDLISEVGLKIPSARFTNHYGQSETGPLCIYNSSHPKEKAGTVGRPAAGVEIKIVDPEGREVTGGKTGEIICKGPFLMSGYYQSEEETNTYFKSGDGWGWTGDLAKKDTEGFITLVGRSKEMIISGGVNIYPREIEIVLEKHENIIDCTVFGVPDDKWGEALVAYVVPRKREELTKQNIIDHCMEYLARFKRPKYIQIVDNIAKTPSGKVQKPILRAAFLNNKNFS